MIWVMDYRFLKPGYAVSTVSGTSIALYFATTSFTFSLYIQVCLCLSLIQVTTPFCRCKYAAAQTVSASLNMNYRFLKSGYAVSNVFGISIALYFDTTSCTFSLFIAVCL